jgi:hypothetical protein
VSAQAALPSGSQRPDQRRGRRRRLRGIGSLCTSGTGNLSVGSGTVPDGQWATATFTATLPNTTTTTGWTSFISTVNGPVGFTMTGTYRWVMV